MDLRKALADYQFELFYQPLHDLSSREVTGFEALLRWRHPERGLLSPAEFIPVAEEIGLIIPIGAWVLERACAELSRLSSRLKIAVNLSPAQFRTRELVQHVTSALANSAIEPHRLELELTESTLLHGDRLTQQQLHELRALGVRIAMDDFGTGYSSLSYLLRFPFDTIKIDRSFVSELGKPTGSSAIVRAITELASGLGITTIAEGVETLDQLERLSHLGCRQAQGFYFSPPRPSNDILTPFVVAENDQPDIAIAAVTA
jgi:EAL domain-containing protein (putative c-di-GMP-specific phosphodiesterase class I)